MASASEFSAEVEDGGGHPTPSRGVLTSEHRDVHGGPRVEHEACGFNRLSLRG